jgi:hypothetical protein
MHRRLGSAYFFVTEALGYTLIGSLTGLAWAWFGSFGVLAVLVLALLVVRPANRLRWRVARSAGIAVSGPSAAQVVFSQTAGVLALMMTAGLLGVRIAPLAVLGLALATLVAATGVMAWLQAHSRRQ